MQIILGVIIFFQIIQLIFLFYVGAFLFRFKKNTGDLLIAIFDEVSLKKSEEKPIEKEKPKTWDQKFEEELTVVEKMRRENSKGGLQDVPGSIL